MCWRPSRIERGKLAIERVDHPQRDRDLFVRDRGQRDLRQPRAARGGQQASAPVRQPMVVEHRVDAR